MLLGGRPSHLRDPVICRRAGLLDHLTVYTHLHGDLLPTCVNLLSVAAYDVHRERSPRQAGQGSVGGISQVPLVFTQPQSFGKWAIIEGSGPRLCLYLCLSGTTPEYPRRGPLSCGSVDIYPSAWQGGGPRSYGGGHAAAILDR